MLKNNSELAQSLLKAAELLKEAAELDLTPTVVEAESPTTRFVVDMDELAKLAGGV